jgi:hypothetical protein
MDQRNKDCAEVEVHVDSGTDRVPVVVHVQARTSQEPVLKCVGRGGELLKTL